MSERMSASVSKVFVQNPGVKASGLRAGEGIGKAPDGVQFLGDLKAVPRLRVPLNVMCSMKWEIPFCSSISSLEPTLTQMPRETER